LLKQTGRPSNHWIALQLTGTRSNRSALGAKVAVTAGGRTQSDEVRSGGSYLSQSDTRLHFGLGSASRIEKLEIHWPDGKSQIFEDVAGDHFYRVKEGQKLTEASSR
ncbi:MAG TPA: ASPIC/UnbV domain-containing protein, partial [Edaphobacter sp.]|nr:ASPIC/UnbV domain-containing protein [Edaphobacter sp.]